jgi:hypothetical protein
MYTIEVESEQIDAIIVSELKSSIDGLEADLNRALNFSKSEDSYLGVWTHSPEEDMVEIQKHISALKLIVKYYNGESTIF